MKWKIRLPGHCDCKILWVSKQGISLSNLNKIGQFLEVLRKKHETLIWVFNNGDAYFFTNYNEKMVSTGDNDYLLDQIRRKAEDIVVIYHNHQTYEEFSGDDLRSYFELKDLGFGGRYGLYVVKTNQVIYAEERSAMDRLRKIDAMRIFVEQTGYNPGPRR